MINDDNAKQTDAEQLENLAASNEIQSFKPEEMLVCEKCVRKTPPTRANCFYCGNPLPTAALLRGEHSKLDLRLLESWEKGFNVIVKENGNDLNSAAVAELAPFLSIEAEDLRAIFAAEKFLPVARVESELQARAVAAKLAAKGIASRIFADDLLRPEIAPHRLRALEFFDDRIVLIFFNNDEIAEIKIEDLALVVAGAIYERRIESTEGIRRKEKGKVQDLREIGTDEILLDVYARRDAVGYRIASKGFDFSCLGGEKGLLVAENMRRLGEKLRNLSPGVRFDDDYQRLRGALGKVWTVDENTNASGVNRKSFGGFRRTNVMTVSNLSQFTRYSRLQREVL